MNRRGSQAWIAGWVAALAILGLMTPRAALAQEPGKPGVVEEDLGDGFRAVSVNGGPPAIIDDATGMILKEAYGRAIIHDPQTGATLFLDDDGELAIKGATPRGGDEGAEVPERIERMKAFWERAEAYSRGREGAGGAGAARAEGSRVKSPGRRPARSWDDVVTAILELLDVDDESELILAPRLRAVLLERDEIQRSRAPLVGLEQPGTSRTLPGSHELPAAIRAYLRAFRASGQDDGDASALEQGLAGYRAARQAQDAELVDRRARLREVVTMPQEAKLVALGILD